ncbi:MAG: acyl-CoA reductase [Pseudonocardiaceae bacterium]
MNRTPTELILPACVRGDTLVSALVPFPGRTAQTAFQGPAFQSPDPWTLLPLLPLRDPTRMRDLQELPHAEIVAFLAQVGKNLELPRNPFLQEALHHCERWSEIPPSLLRANFAALPALFTADAVSEVANTQIGAPFLDGWNTVTLGDGRRGAVRAFGARTVHIIAGNVPAVAAMTVIRSAITRSDAVIKTPSNDPFTATAIVRTMYATDSEHPLARHTSAAYWRGGDEEFEQQLYRPELVEKIVAWGGLDSIRYITRYIQPGLELISLDPKRSASLVGPEALADPTALADVARRIAVDAAAYNQMLCVNARVVHVITGSDPQLVSRVEQLGKLVHEAIQALPPDISTASAHLDPELQEYLHALRYSPDWYSVISGKPGAGAVVISWVGEPVDFHRLLSGRVVNLVPVDDLDTAVRSLSSWTQTVGVYPDTLKDKIRNLLPLFGVQRIVSLGIAPFLHQALPQDSIEPVRRMIKWVVDETPPPADRHQRESDLS